MKTRVAMLFGGKSVEHEVSVISGIQAVMNMDTDKYEVIPGSSDFLQPGANPRKAQGLRCLGRFFRDYLRGSGSSFQAGPGNL